MLPVLFLAAAFSNAFLLFLVEPLVGKLMLPVLGGAPAVWNTLVFFFQTALLGGYVYAHLSRRLAAGRQLALHAVVIAAGAALLPVALPAGWVAPGVERPLVWVYVLAAVMVGGPFFAIASAAPLVQRWFSLTRHPDARDPYFLYAATNAGSLAGLLAFPLAVEPLFRLSEQSRLWTIGYIVAGVLTLAAGAAALRHAHQRAGRRRPDDKPDPGPDAPAADRWRLRGTWLVLALVPSSLMLGVTTHVTTDIAAFPLMLTVPLALYLVTFVVAFSRRRLVPRRVIDAVFPLAALPVLYTVALQPTDPFWLLVPMHLLCFVVLALGCHLWLAESRPAPARLTEYYLWIALGGVLGGVFNGVLAPVLFDAAYEYPLMVAVACFVRPATDAVPRSRRGPLAIDALIALALGAAVWPAHRLAAVTTAVDQAMAQSLAFGFLLLVASAVAAAPRRYALAVSALLVASQIQASVQQPALFTGRSYFGVMRVTGDEQGTRQLIHGSTIHGTQLRDGSRDLVPAAYYSPEGPAGDIMPHAGPSVAVVGLGTGALACYARPGQEWTFFEIDPLVERIARDTSLFTYLSGCLPDARVVIGDARVGLGRADDGAFSSLVIDAFNSDAIPVHLLTREAIHLYVRKVKPGGFVALHISNRHMALEAVLGRSAADLGFSGRVKADDGDDAWHLGSSWAVLAREDVDLEAFAEADGWQSLPADGAPLWTDDYANVMRALHWWSPRGGS